MMNRENRGLSFVVLAWLAVLCGGAAFAQTPQGYPPPGNYLIDSESTYTLTSGGSTIEHVTRVVGSTGDTTVTQKNSMDGVPPHTQTHKGTGPNSSCIKPYGSGGPPAALTPFLCKPLARSADPRSSSISDECSKSKVDQAWRRIDDRTWERSLTFTASPGGTTSSPQEAMKAAMAMALPNMTPGERAKAQSEMAALAAQSQAEMAQLTEIAQVQARTGKPEDAAMAKKLLQEMRRSSGGGLPADLLPRVRERWTRVADTCPAKR